MRLVATALALTFLAAPATAEEWVEFRDGRVMRVSSVTIQANQATVEMQGGGAFSIPASTIVRREPIGTRKPSEKPGRPQDGKPAPWKEMAGRYADLIEKTANKYNLDPVLLASVAHVESRFNPDAVSPKNAQGMLQLIPATAARFGVENAFDVEQNVEGGARYLRWLLDRYDGETTLALAAYPAGEGAVDRYNGVPPYYETVSYVTQVLEKVIENDE